MATTRRVIRRRTVKVPGKVGVRVTRQVVVKTTIKRR